MTVFTTVKTFAAVCAATCILGSSAFAAPIGAASASLLAGGSNVEPVRTYCYKRSTGEFKHWGPCTNLFRVCSYDGCRLERRFW